MTLLRINVIGLAVLSLWGMILAPSWDMAKIAALSFAVLMLWPEKKK